MFLNEQRINRQQTCVSGINKQELNADGTNWISVKEYFNILLYLNGAEWKSIWYKVFSHFIEHLKWLLLTVNFQCSLCIFHCVKMIISSPSIIIWSSFHMFTLFLNKLPLDICSLWNLGDIQNIFTFLPFSILQLSFLCLATFLQYVTSLSMSIFLFYDNIIHVFKLSSITIYCDLYHLASWALLPI